MGKTQEKLKRIVLDTNILVSALLFKGVLSKFVELWRKRKIIPIISRETFEEFTTVLQYPKFSLSNEEIRSIIEHEILPYFEVIEVVKAVKGVCRDPGDDKFISCALSASAGYIVSGDKDLCDLRQHKTVKIMNASDFLKKLYRSEKI
jgi:putative PIN family toxin of toxin-antitoxin system